MSKQPSAGPSTSQPSLKPRPKQRKEPVEIPARYFGIPLDGTDFLTAPDVPEAAKEAVRYAIRIRQEQAEQKVVEQKAAEQKEAGQEVAEQEDSQATVTSAGPKPSPGLISNGTVGTLPYETSAFAHPPDETPRLSPKDTPTRSEAHIESLLGYEQPQGAIGQFNPLAAQGLSYQETTSPAFASCGPEHEFQQAATWPSHLAGEIPQVPQIQQIPRGDQDCDQRLDQLGVQLAEDGTQESRQGWAALCNRVEYLDTQVAELIQRDLDREGRALVEEERMDRAFLDFQLRMEAQMTAVKDATR